MSKLVSFAVVEENAITPEEIEASQFRKVHFRIYSADRVNAHGYSCSLRVLKKYAKTICGKPILAYYNKFANAGRGDCAGHEDSDWAREYPIGFFPQDTKITYEKSDDGTIYLCADGYIWDVYYSHISKLFEENGGKKGVSSEMLIIESEVVEETNVEEILQYSFTGVTILGDTDAYGNPIAPAVEGCHGVLVANAKTNEEYQKAKKEFEKVLNAVNQESVNADSFFIQKNEKEELMAKEKKTNSNPSEVVDNAEQVVTTRVKVSTDTHTYDDRGYYMGSSSESHKKETTRVIEVPDDQVDAPAMNATEEKNPSEGKDEKVENATDAQDSPETADNACKKRNATEDNPESKDDPEKENNACKNKNASSEEDPEKEDSCRNKNATKDDPQKEDACRNKNAVEDDPQKEENSCKNKNATEEDPEKTENACKSKNADDPEKDPEKEEACRNKNSTVSKEEYNALVEKYNKLLSKCQKLEEYKNNRDSEDMKNAVEIALNSVSHVLNADQINEWRKESENYSYSQLDDFRNKLKAFAFDISENSGIPHEETLRNSIPMNIDDDSEDIWDRLSKKYTN